MKNFLTEKLFQTNNKNISNNAIPLGPIVLPYVLGGNIIVMSISLGSINIMLLQKELLYFRIFPIIFINGLVIMYSFKLITVLLEYMNIFDHNPLLYK